MLLLLLPHPAGSFDLCGVWPQPAGPCSDWYCPLWPGSASLPPWIGWPSSRWSISVSATRRISSFWPESVRLMGNGIQLKWLGVSLVNIVFIVFFLVLKMPYGIEWWTLCPSAFVSRSWAGSPSPLTFPVPFYDYFWHDLVFITDLKLKLNSRVCDWEIK